MSQLERIVHISAAPEVVWQVLVDVTRWHEWTPSITRIEPLDDSPLAIGSRFKVVQPKLSPAVWTVSDAQAVKRFTWKSRALGSQTVADHIIESNASGCMVTLRITFTGVLAPLAGWFAGALTEQYISLEAAGLKQRCERR